MHKVVMFVCKASGRGQRRRPNEQNVRATISVQRAQLGQPKRIRCNMKELEEVVALDLDERGRGRREPREIEESADDLTVVLSGGGRGGRASGGKASHAVRVFTNLLRPEPLPCTGSENESKIRSDATFEDVASGT